MMAHIYSTPKQLQSKRDNQILEAPNTLAEKHQFDSASKHFPKQESETGLLVNIISKIQLANLVNRKTGTILIPWDVLIGSKYKI